LGIYRRAASFLPLAIYEFGTIPHLYQSLDLAGYLGIAYGAIFSSAAGYTLYAWGLSKISASDAAVFPMSTLSSEQY